METQSAQRGQKRGWHSLLRDALYAPPLRIPEAALGPFPVSNCCDKWMLTMVVLVPQIKAESAAGRPAHQLWCCTQRGRARRGMERTRLVAARHKTPGWGPWGPAHPSPHFPPDSQQWHFAVPSVVPGHCPLNPAEGRGVWEPRRSSLAFPSVSSPELTGRLCSEGLGW